MCAKASKPLTSFQPASLLLVWDSICGFKCMMYDVLFALPILRPMVKDLRYVLGYSYLYSYAYMVLGL